VHEPGRSGFQQAAAYRPGRHRLHHLYSDRAGDPNKRPEDGFWVTFFRSQVPYACVAEPLREPIFRTWPVRLINNPLAAVIGQFTSFGLLWLVVDDWRLTATLWLGIRLIASYVHWIQNYWAHDRRFGYRRYDDERDNAMNIGEWLPVTATFSACLQNNHHHSPGLLRLSHVDWEYDFGFMTVKAMKALGLVQATDRGATLPKDVPLTALEF